MLLSDHRLSRSRRLPATLAVYVLLASTGCGARFETAGQHIAGPGQAVDGLNADQGLGAGAAPGVPLGGSDRAGTGSTGSAGTTGGPSAGAGGATQGTSRSPRMAPQPGTGPVAPAGKGSTFGINGQTITVCYLFPKTGAAPLPPNVADAIDAYWDFVNSRGGLQGFKVKPQICDTQSTVAGAQAAVQKAKDIEAFAVVSLDRLESERVMAELLFKAGIPHISLMNAPGPDPKWQKQTFFISTDQGTVGKLVAKYFQARKFKNVAVVSEANDANIPKVLAPFLKEAKARGHNVVSSDIKLDPNSSSGYATQCAQLASKDPDSVWLYASATPAIQFVNACASYKPVWFSSEFLWDYNLAPGAAPGLRGAEGFGRWATLSETERIAPFQKAFDSYVASGRSQGGQSGNTKTLQDLAIIAWGSSQILANGILNAAQSPVGLGRDTFLDAMHHLKLGSMSPAEKTPLLWSPVDFTGGKLFGAPEITSVWKVSNDAEPIWERVSGYQSEF